MNASFDGRPVRVRLESGHIVLIDPLALDGLSAQLVEVGTLPVAEQFSKLQALGQEGLRIGVRTLEPATPGTYEISLDSFEAVDDDDDSDPSVFETDTGAVIIIDGGALSAVARTLTWDRYDALLQVPLADDSLLTEVVQEVGGPRFAIVSADAGRSFSGDGAFRLVANGLELVE
jgi:hypothetical protein